MIIIRIHGFVLIDANSRNDLSNNLSRSLHILLHKYVPLPFLLSIYSNPDEAPFSATLEFLFFLAEDIHDKRSYSNDTDTNFLIMPVTVLEQPQQEITRQLLVIWLLCMNKEQSITHT